MQQIEFIVTYLTVVLRYLSFKVTMEKGRYTTISWCQNRERY